MAKFYYKAKRGPDEIVEGNVDADSIDTAVEKLNQQGYVPFVVEAGNGNSQKAAVRPSKKKIRSKDINVFTRQLANLLRSKVTLPAALGIIHEQTEHVVFKGIIKELRDNVKGGGSVSDVLEKYPKYFSMLYVNTVKSGEIGCVMEESLLRLADFADAEEELRTRIKIAVAYPIFMFITGVATIIVLLTFVMPKLSMMFEDMGQSLPVPTQIILTLSSGMRDYWYWMLTGAALFVFFFKKRGVSKKERYAIDRIQLKLPIAGRFIRESQISRFAKTVALLLDNGVSLYQAIDATIPTLSNIIIKDELKKISQNIVAGLSFSKCLQQSKSFPPFVVSMIAVGEEGGTLSSALNDVAEYYEREGDQAMKIMSSLLEPAMILGMGLIIGFMVISMLLPIFELNVMSGR